MHDGTFRRRFDESFPSRRLVGFYAARPKRFWQLFERGCARALVMRPRLGNFVEAAGKPPRAMSRAFALWSDGKAALVNQGRWLLPLILAGTVAGGLAGFFLASGEKFRWAWLAAAFLAAMAMLEFIVVMLAQGQVDLDRHLYTFHAMLDTSLIVVVTTSLATAVARWPAPGRSGR